MIPPAYLGVGLDLDLSEPMLVRENRIPPATAKAADVGSLTRAQNQAVDSVPLPPATTRSVEKLSESPGNLIAFDSFDAFDSALEKSEKLKLPKLPKA